MITRTDRHQSFSPDGLLVAEEVVEVDITAPSIQFDLHAKARQALADNAAFLALSAPTNAQVLAQVRRLTRQNGALIRLVLASDGASDLLTENTDT